jgi:hypothetical protein
MSPAPVSRRRLLQTAAGGFGYLALAELCAEAREYQSPLAPRASHFPAKAKRVIFLCMRGGPSQMETFDYKAKLNADNLKPGRTNPNFKLFGSQWRFRQHGQSGLWISDLLPHLAQHADKLCVINSMHTDNENHPQALEQLHTGSFQFIRPSVGSWVVYGLGTENRNLPGFIALNPLSALGGSRYYSSAFLPASFQATTIGEAGRAIRQAQIANLVSPRLTQAGQRRQLDLLQTMNRELADRQNDPRLEGLIETFELSFRMQSELPRVMDFTGETRETLDLYGIDQGESDDFGRQCLLARRFAEAGVRFIELTHQDWDHHGFVSNLMPRACRQIDKPIAGLLQDLQRRGLLEDTLIVWGGEFGRTPDDPTQDGRGHNHKGFTMFLAGAGVRGGLAYGKTDDYGYEAVENKVHLHDLHATMLHLLGLDHERLTYRHGGRDFRLTDVHGQIVRGILA